MVAQVELQRLDDLGSQKSSICSRFSTSVTRVPSAAKIDAYSTPITPAPTTTIESGTVSKVRIWSESSTRAPSNSTFRGRAGTVPVAITILSAVQRPVRRRALDVDRQRVRVDEAGHAGDQLDVVAQQLRADHLGLATDHVLQPGQQVGDRDVFLDPVARAVQVAQLHAGQVEHGLAQSLRRDRAGVDADTADHGLAVDDDRPCVRASPP